MKPFIKLSFALVLALAAPSIWAADNAYQIVVNAANPIRELPRDDVSRMFLKKIKSWEHGLQVMPVDQEPATSVRRAFSLDIHNRSSSTIESYWRRNLFEGLATPPPEVNDDRVVLDFVGQNPGAIGYVSANTRVENGVRVLVVK